MFLRIKKLSKFEDMSNKLCLNVQVVLSFLVLSK